MPESSCSKCKQPIVAQPELGDRQGGVREVVHMATTWRITLCSTCVAPLFELYILHVEEVLMQGTAQGREKFQYLPRARETEEAPPTSGASPSLSPKFSQG